MTGKIHKPGDLVAKRYQVLSFLGEGGMQEVYRSRDLLLERDVALKTPKNHSAAKRFKRSAVVSAQVNHANVAKTLDYLEEDGRTYLVEEIIDGKDLSRVLKEHVPHLDPHLVARVFHQLARGIAASHHAGVIHRDLKPSNIVAVEGVLVRELKITDFGIAKMAEEELSEAVEGGEESLTASQTAIGALPYMAPEMIASMKNAEFAADIWSLGALVLELLTGEKPFGVGLKAVPVILSGKLPNLPPACLSAQFQPLALEIFEVAKLCLQLKPGLRPTADALVGKCESFCYPITPRELGKVRELKNSQWGFIKADDGSSIFFHKESVFGDKSVSPGDKVLFARHAGTGSDRAFPVLKLRG